MENLNFKQYWKKSGIYRIVSKDGRVYIGSSTNLYDRARTHISHLKRNCHKNTYLQRFYNKYGDSSLNLEVIEICEPEEVIKREQYWIDKLECKSPNGFNLLAKAGSIKGYKHTDETKRLISLAHKGKPSPRKGTSQRQEVKDIISTKNKGKIAPNRIPVKLLKKDGSEQTFLSMSEAADFFSIQVSTIHNNLKGLSKTTKQGIWQKVSQN